MKKLSIFFLFLFVLDVFPQAAQADGNVVCNKISVEKENSQQQIERFTLTQFGFDNKPELAIFVHTNNLPTQVKQVTFNRGQAQLSCYFKPLAFAQGGEGAQYWGWHMLWQEGTENSATQGLFYARMDGDAWVSSSPKRLTKLAPINLQFKLNNQNISVTWQQVENGVTTNMKAVSDDEGRSWDLMSE